METAYTVIFNIISFILITSLLVTPLGYDAAERIRNGEINKKTEMMFFIGLLPSVLFFNLIAKKPLGIFATYAWLHQGAVKK